LEYGELKLLYDSSGIEQMRITPRRYTSDQCPICLHPHRLGIETNCGHVFCGKS